MKENSVIEQMYMINDDIYQLGTKQTTTKQNKTQSQKKISTVDSQITRDM